jgi:hypothetical protein
MFRDFIRRFLARVHLGGKLGPKPTNLRNLGIGRTFEALNGLGFFMMKILNLFIPNRMLVPWNSVYAQLLCTRTHRAQVEKIYETFPAKLEKNMREYWLLLDEHLASSSLQC